MPDELAHHALTHSPKEKAPKPLKEMHIKEMHSGGFHVMRHDGKAMTEHGAADIDGLHDHLHEHFGGKAPEGEKAGGDDGAAESKEE